MMWHSIIKLGFIWISPTTIKGIVNAKQIYLDFFHLGNDNKTK